MMATFDALLDTKTTCSAQLERKYSPSLGENLSELMMVTVQLLLIYCLLGITLFLSVSSLDNYRLFVSMLYHNQIPQYVGKEILGCNFDLMDIRHGHHTWFIIIYIYIYVRMIMHIMYAIWSWWFFSWCPLVLAYEFFQFGLVPIK